MFNKNFWNFMIFILKNIQLSKKSSKKEEENFFWFDEYQFDKWNETIPIYIKIKFYYN